MHYVPVSLRGTRTAKLQCVPAFALDSFERQAEAFLRARAWREWNFLSGQRPGRGLITLYDQDFPSFTSTDLWNDLQAASPEEPGQHQAQPAELGRRMADRASRPRESDGHPRDQGHALVGDSEPGLGA